MKYPRNFILCVLFSYTSFVAAESVINLQIINIEEKKELPFGDTSLDLDFISTKKMLNIDTGDLLNNFLGTNSIKNGGFSSLPLLQGLSNDRIKVKIDGMDIISSCANHMNPPLSYTSPANIHDIDVLAGLSSVSQGGDNIGGVINVKSNSISFSKSEKRLNNGKIKASSTLNIDGVFMVVPENIAFANF